MNDKKLPFGAAKSCSIFQRLTNSVVRMMSKRGFTCIGYLDDYLIIGDTKTRCMEGYKCLSVLLEDLGFRINWGKARPPTQTLTFLGIEICTWKRTLSLPHSKLTEVKELVNKWCYKKRVSKVELQSLVGKLNWCAKLVRGGRSFLRRLIDLSKTVDHPNWHVKLDSNARADLNWWKVGLSLFHGTTCFPIDLPLPSYSYSTDSCMVGGAGHFGTKWFYTNWEVDYPEHKEKHITFLELLSIVISIKKWGPCWRGLHVRVRTDNVAAMSAINNATSKSQDLMLLVREMFWLCVKFECRITACYIKGVDNIVSDRLSRLHEPSAAMEAWDLMFMCDPDCVFAEGHMSYSSFLALQSIWRLSLTSC